MCANLATNFAHASGVDYNAREMYNMHLDNEYYAGKLHEDEYQES